MSTPNGKYYLAGPMTNIPAFNYPAFHEAAETLRDAGWLIVSPAEIDDPATAAVVMSSPDGSLGSGSINGETWGDFLARDVKIVADDVAGIVFLDGWQKSRGARLEAFVGLLTGREFWLYTAQTVTQVKPAWIAKELQDSLDAYR